MLSLVAALDRYASILHRGAAEEQKAAVAAPPLKGAREFGAMVDEVAAALATAACLRFCLGGAIEAAAAVKGAESAEGAEGAEEWISGATSRLRRAACVVHGGVAAYAWRPAGGGGGGGGGGGARSVTVVIDPASELVAASLAEAGGSILMSSVTNAVTSAFGCNPMGPCCNPMGPCCNPMYPGDECRNLCPRRRHRLARPLLVLRLRLGGRWLGLGLGLGLGRA